MNTGRHIRMYAHDSRASHGEWTGGMIDERARWYVACMVVMVC